MLLLRPCIFVWVHFFACHLPLPAACIFYNHAFLLMLYYLIDALN